MSFNTSYQLHLQGVDVRELGKTIIHTATQGLMGSQVEPVVVNGYTKTCVLGANEGAPLDLTNLVDDEAKDFTGLTVMWFVLRMKSDSGGPMTLNASAAVVDNYPLFGNDVGVKVYGPGSVEIYGLFGNGAIIGPTNRNITFTAGPYGADFDFSVLVG